MSLVHLGDGGQPALLLLPPLGADHRFFAPLLEHLSLDAWVADVVPTGAERSVADVAERVARDLAAAGMVNVAVLGVSLGGLVAQHLAATHPELVSHLMLADTVITYPEALRTMWHDRAALVEAEGLDPVLDATLDTWFGPDRTGELETRCTEMVLTADPAGYAASCRALRDADTLAVLDDITAPTLVLCGQLDGKVFLDGAEALAARLSPISGVSWLRGGHHAALLECPEQAAALVAGHLEVSAS